VHNGQFRNAVAYLCQVSKEVVKRMSTASTKTARKHARVCERDGHSQQSLWGNSSCSHKMAAPEMGWFAEVQPLHSYCCTMNLLLAVPLFPSTSQYLTPPDTNLGWARSQEAW